MDVKTDLKKKKNLMDYFLSFEFSKISTGSKNIHRVNLISEFIVS